MAWYYNPLGWVASQFETAFFEQLAEKNKKENEGIGNRYSESGKVGVVLTWIEKRPVIGKLLISLGDNREKLYKILTSSDGNKVSSKGLPQFHDFDGLIG